MAMETAVRLRRARVAVTVVFTAHGMVCAAWVARIPQIKEHLGLSAGAMGLAMLGAPVGVMVAVRFAGRAVGRWGSRAVTLAAGVGAALSLVPLGLAWNLGSLVCALALLGAGIGLMDVSMNAQGVAVERGYGRPLMSGMHGAYSVGNLLAALAGSAAAHAHLPVALHLTVAAAVLVTLVAVGCRDLLDRSIDVVPEPAAAGAAVMGSGPGVDGAGRPAGRWPLVLLGVIGLCSFVGEGAMADWSAIYLREDLGTGPGVAGLGYAGCAVAMTGARLFGDRIVARLGPVRVLRAGALVAAAGLGAGLAADG
ncbi:MFS transporter, partial [Actinomadura roseirufa]|uniref:MFS transporter n=1 Tax=Actinomadura roseirufa TaxID=2094049 RepID=UPI001041AFF2